MKLLVIYVVKLYDELADYFYSEEKNIIINAPENLLQSQYKDFTYEKYYEEIEELEKDLNYQFNDLEIKSVNYITELIYKE